jgi:NAD-dependent dihydropyrimidine dehydrogenase PreA subunit
MINASAVNTLRYELQLCNGCRMCENVCPHGVFAVVSGKAELVKPDECMECGACERNCPTGAIKVDSGIGCASAMIIAALLRKKQAPT